MSEARKLAAIMAIDVVGYSRLMGEDEAGTARGVRERREAAEPLVASRGGRIVKTMGDGLLLEFPSVVDAVECAIAIQALMAERNAGVPEQKRIVYRVGVHLGDVLIEGDDILGEGVNIAARLEGICQPGGFASRARRMSTSAGGSGPSSPISARRRSKTSRGRCGSMRWLRARRPRRRRLPRPRRRLPARRGSRSSCCRSPISAATRSRNISSTG